jgi:hypothetical protein
VTLAGTVASMKQVRRVAAGGGLRLVVEAAGADQVVTPLTEADVDRPLTDLLAVLGEGIPPEARVFLRCGRQLIELTRDSG